MSERPDLKLIDAAASDDPYDLEQLRIDPSRCGGRQRSSKLLLTVPVRKPNKQDFVRVHPGPQYRETQAFIELKEDREIFAVDLARGARTAGRVLFCHAVHGDQPGRRGVPVAGQGAGRPTARF